MSAPEIDITIGPYGRLDVRVRGASGARCLAITDLLAEIVGSEQSRELTSEYFGPDGSTEVNVDQQQCVERNPP